MSMVRPCLIRSVVGAELRSIRLGHPLLDDYLEFLGPGRGRTPGGRGLRPEGVLHCGRQGAAAVITADVFAFIKAQRAPRRGPGWCGWDGEAGLSVRTVKRRLASVSGLFAYLVTRGDAACGQPGAPRDGGAPGRQRLDPAGHAAGPDPADVAPRSAPGRGRRADCRWCGPTGTGRWSRRWCSAGCAAARSSGCGSGISRSASDGCSSPRARAGISGSAGLGAVLRHPGRLPGPERPAEPGTDRVFVVLKGSSRGDPLSRPGWTRSSRGPPARRDRSPDLSPAAPYLSDPVAGGRDGARGGAGPVGFQNSATLLTSGDRRSAAVGRDRRRVAAATV